MYTGKIKVLLSIILLLMPACKSLAGGVCFRGKPSPECRTFWITEAGAFYRLDGQDVKSWQHRKLYEKLLYSIDVGLMFNRSPGDALGASIFIDYDDYTGSTKLGLRPRYRRWLSRLIRIDIAPGIVLDDTKFKTPNFSGLLSLNFSDYVALMLRLDINSWEKRYGVNQAGGTEYAWYGGLKFGSYPGLVVGIVGPIVAAAIWASNFGGTGGMQF
jgi:hypothetical protein